MPTHPQHPSSVTDRDQILDLLVQSQNPDGGWGYFQRRTSWMEPTFYAFLALRDAPEHASRLEKSWAAIRSWQMDDGGCRPNPEVQESNWCTALWVTLHCVRGQFDDKFQKGLNWLLEARGAEGALWRRILHRFQEKQAGYEPSRYGWSWFPETNSWVEPSVHALVALKKTLLAGDKATGGTASHIRHRLELGESMLLDRRCKDGGWNYGSQSALEVALPSYPETTALALLALQGASPALLKPSLDRAQQMLQDTRSPLAQAWLTVSLRLHGVSLAENPSAGAPPDVLVASLQRLAATGQRTQNLAAGGVA